MISILEGDQTMFVNRSDQRLGGEVAGRSCVDDNEEKEIKAFYHYLIHHSQNERWSKFFAGSRFEIPGQENLLHQYGLNMDLLDLDIMICVTNIYVTSNRETLPDQFNGRVVRIYSRNLHASYVKLFDVDVETELKRTDVTLFRNLGTTLQGPANIMTNTEYWENNNVGKSFISKDDWITHSTNITTKQDHVMAVHSRYWPQQMNEWITRRRLSGLPSKSIIKQVVRYGCDFVQVSHKLSTDTNEWRFSFSKAELIIIRSWTTSQRCVYRTLHMLNKMIKSSVDDSKLCTYYFKTLMLWATEEKPAEFWYEHVLINSVYVLLYELMYWLEQMFCPNYFIPTNNMMDHLTDTELSEDIDALCQLLKNQHQIVDVLSSSRLVEADYSNMKFYIKVPVWLYATLLITEQLDYHDNIFTELFTKSSPNLVDQAMFIEFSNIYNALYYYTMAGNSLIQSDNYYLMKSIEHFHCYTDSRSSQATVVVLCSMTIATRLMPEWFAEYKPDTCESHSFLVSPNGCTSADSLNVLNMDSNQIDEKCLLYSQSMHNIDETMTTDIHYNENIDGNSKTTVTLYRTLTVDNKTNTDEFFYKEWTGMSPTVNISWFINNSYLASLYYITRRDYSAIEEICDDIIHVCQQSWCNHIFADALLPVVLSTESTSVYDEVLQVMLGLYSLCSFMFNKTDHSRSVYLGVCPVQFALYLKYRCAVDQMDIQRCNKCVKETDEHFKECISGRRVCNSQQQAVYSSLKFIEWTFKRLLTFS